MVLTLFMLLLLCLGSEMRTSASREFMESMEALSWPTAAGKVTRSELKLRLIRLGLDRVMGFYGAWSYSSSRWVSAEEINIADRQMLSVWRSPASEFDSLSEKSKALYKASVMLFVEGGDGYGALIYHPTSSGGDYYWIHQDNLDQPVKLVDNQDKPRDYSSAMRWIIANQILFYYDDIFDGTFIDRSSTTSVPYQLRLNFPSQKQLETKQLEVRLEVEWNKFE